MNDSASLTTAPPHTDDDGRDTTHARRRRNPDADPVQPTVRDLLDVRVQAMHAAIRDRGRDSWKIRGCPWTDAEVMARAAAWEQWLLRPTGSGATGARRG